MGGGKGKSPKIPQSPSDVEQARQLRKFAQDVQEPTRALLTPLGLDALAQNNPFSTRLMAPDRQAIESQFGQARQSVMQNTPGRGGQLNRQLFDLERARAGDVADATIQQRQLGTQRALGLLGGSSFPGAEATLSALGGIAGRDSQRLAAQAQMRASAQNAKGQGIGGLLGNLGTSALGAGGWGGLFKW